MMEMGDHKNLGGHLEKSHAAFFNPIDAFP